MISLFRRIDLKVYSIFLAISIFLRILVFSLNARKHSTFSVVWIYRVSLLGGLAIATKPKERPKRLMMLFSILFFLILCLNVFSIFPFSFPFTTQISGVLYMGLLFWSVFILFSIFRCSKKFISHKVPEGSPLPLSFFLFLIELIRELIRPLTLRLRLVGNMVVGHVLLSLLFLLVEASQSIFPLFLFLNMVEIGVCFIQSYIFFTLVSMYFSEV